VAIYYLGMKTFGRARGKSGSRATSAAAYRAGERIRDERTGAVYDHRRRQDVLHKEILLPSRLAAAGAELDWARSRPSLWNAAERAESRSNARVAREVVLGLPHELSTGERTGLARRFAQELADRYRSAVDLVIHAPRGDPRNFHAHLLATTREVTEEGLGTKTALELSGTERHRRGLPRWKEEIASLRERWVGLANEALKAAHVDARVHPPLPWASTADRERAPHLPLAAYYMERRGERSFLADRIRAKHRARLAAEERERAQPDGAAREAARKWLAYRRAKEAEAQVSAVRDAADAGSVRDAPTVGARRRERDNDFGL
jgi:RNase H-fold protein (predicted Holliday junction resolvase)